MMSNIAKTQPDYHGTLPVEEVLEAAKSEVVEVVVVGWDENGDLYFAGSSADKRDLGYLLHTALHRLMSGDFDSE